jgi:hypothetical protein
MASSPLGTEGGEAIAWPTLLFWPLSPSSTCSDHIALWRNFPAPMGNGPPRPKPPSGLPRSWEAPQA